MRTFSLVLLFLTAIAAVAWTHLAQARTNVLFICADDHAPYVCGAYGNSVVRTPNIDRLAREGMRFDRAYCNSPVCTASRQSFLTGRYPRSIGVTQLRTALPEGEITLSEVLLKAGYETAAIGKMHFNSDLTHGFETRIDHPQHRQWLRQKGETPIPSDVAVLPQWRPFRDPAEIWLNGFYRPFGAVDADMTGTFFAEQAAAFLNETQRERPFFLIVSFYEPHSPFRFPIEFAGRHDPASFAVPPVVAADEPQIPEIFRHLSDEDKQGIIASYYTSAEFLDKNVGIVLDALKESGQADDTLVVYLGDHGYMLGQHGRFEKHCSFEPAVRSPLLMRLPGRVTEDSHTSALVEFIDIVPTVLDVCHIAVPPTVQGKSLLPLLTGKTDRHRDQIVVEYSENEEAMIRDDRWKLVYTTGKRDRQDGYATGLPLPGRTIRLYDTANDPDELHDLSNDPAQEERIEQLLNDLIDHMVATAREPDILPREAERLDLLDFCLQPRDVSGAAKRAQRKRGGQGSP